MSGANKFSPFLVDAAVLACTFPRPSVVCEMQPVVLGGEKCQSVFLWLPRECFVFCTARQSSTDLESPEISCRQEDSRLVTRSHIFVFFVTAFSVAACELLHACSFVSQPSLLTAQGGIVLVWDDVSENIPSWHGQCFSLLGLYLCSDSVVVLIASIAIWIPDISLYFTVRLETGSFPYLPPSSLSVPWRGFFDQKRSFSQFENSNLNSELIFSNCPVF